MRSILVSIICVLFLTGCNNDPPAKTVFDTQVQALKKARTAEGKIQEGAAQERDRIDQQTGSAPEPAAE